MIILTDFRLYPEPIFRPFGVRDSYLWREMLLLNHIYFSLCIVRIILNKIIMDRIVTIMPLILLEIEIFTANSFSEK